MAMLLEDTAWNRANTTAEKRQADRKAKHKQAEVDKRGQNK
jgi:hypothetical protein